MKKKSVFIVSCLMLFLVIGLAFAAEENVPAQVQVGEFVSVTITPVHNPLDFGNGNPGDTDLQPTGQNNVTAAIVVTNDPLSNKNVDVETKGTDFQNSLSEILAVNNIAFNIFGSSSGATDLSTTYQTVVYGVTPGSNAGVWYFMSIPSGQASGTYTGTISVKA